MNRAEKAKEVEALTEDLGQTANAFLLDFKGLDAARSTDLRIRLRERDARLRIVKNRLVRRAFADTPLALLDEALVGQTAIAYTNNDDAVGLAKILRDFTEEHDVATVKTGLVEGQVIDPEEFKRLADLPSRDELIAKALYLMNYPITGLVTVLSGVMKNFVVVLEQIRQQKESA